VGELDSTAVSLVSSLSRRMGRHARVLT
jgi:hypothetical protein